MNDNEEFFLGDIEEQSEFFLGDNDSSEIEINQEDAEDYKELLSVYETLKIADHPRCKGDSASLQDMFEEYFKDNPDIFIVAGSDYFKPLSESQFSAFETKCDKLVAIAHKHWISIENQSKLEEITAALNTLKAIFRQPVKTDAYSNEIRRTLKAHLNAALRQKVKDKILEVSEIQELLEIAISIHFISDTPAEKDSLLSAIKKANEKNIFKIESFEETFIRNIIGREKIKRLDTDTVRSNLFKEYKSLAEISAQVLVDTKLLNDSELFEEMCQLLSENNVLVSNTELFITDFLEKEIERKGEFYFSVPLISEYFYYLKGTAINIYQLTEDQWRQICMIRNIRVDTETTVAFIMGNYKESSVNGIAKLLKENPETASSRILAGDLETFFTHIGRRNISSKISKLKEAYKTNSAELVTGVVNLLLEEIGDSPIATESTPAEPETIGKLISDNTDIKTIVRFVVENKSNESLIREITTESNVKERLVSLFKSKKKTYSYIQFLMNILHDLLLENDTTQYKHSFVKIASKIGRELDEKNGYISFICVLDNIVSCAMEKSIISNKAEIDGYSELLEKMKILYDEEAKFDNSNNKKKSIFGLLKKGGK